MIGQTGNKLTYEEQRQINKQNKIILKYQVDRLRQIHKELGLDEYVTVPHSGKCRKCKIKWALQLNVEDYSKTGITNCPFCCNSSWIHNKINF